MADECLAAKVAAGVSLVYRRGLKHYLARMKLAFSEQPIADITTTQIDAWLREAHGNHTTKNSLRRILVTTFKWARQQGYLDQERKTAAERAITFHGTESARAIFTPAELQKILAVCPANLLPHIVIGAFSGIRAAEIERLDWRDILWDRGYIEIKAAKAKTKARRLVPLLANLRAWLEPMRQHEGAVCKCPNTSTRLNYIGEKAGFGWRQNALRQSRESFPALEPARIERPEPFRRDARIGHARLEPATAILPARQADVGAMRKNGVEIHVARAASTATRTPPR